MKSVFRLSLDLLLVISLAVTPVTFVLASVNADSGQRMRSATTASCHHHGHEQASAGMQEKTPMMAPCSNCGDNCKCLGKVRCHHATVSPVAALPASSKINLVLGRDSFATTLPDAYSSLSLSPDTPPPTA